jgi:hypothetical protein
MHKCVNNTIGNVYHLEQMVDNFFPYSQKKLGFDKPVTVIFQSDQDNASKMLGKTAYYDPEHYEVVLYTDNRHPKDVMRSLSHELVHHAQNCRGDFTSADSTSPGYAQEDPHLRKMEREAYEKGNLIFRDFEDLIKTGKINIEIDFSDSGEPKMSLKEWKNAELNRNLMKKWGLLKEEKKSFPDLTGDGEVTQADILKGRGVDLDEAHCSRVEDDELNEDSKEEESEHYGEDESADKREEDRLEHHIDRIEHHLEKLRDDMGFDQHREDDHMDEGEELSERFPGIKGQGTPGKVLKARGSRADREAAAARKAKEAEEYRDAEREFLDRMSGHGRYARFEEDIEEGIFSPNHYCVHHGGVQHEGQIKMAEAINHNFDKKLNKVTWYDMKLQDGTILEQVAAEDIMVTNASLAEEHMHRVEDEDDLDEAEGRGRDYKGIGSKESDNMRGDQYGMAKKMRLKKEATSGKISVREAKEITRRIIERIKKEGK